MNDVILTDLDNAKLTEFQLHITPFLEEDISADYDVPLEVLFDNTLIRLEMHDIFINGSAKFLDPKTNSLENIVFRGPVTTANIILRPEEIIIDDDMFPKFEVEGVTLKLDLESTTVSAFGALPLFKTKKFEESIKKWLEKETERSLVPQVKQHFVQIE